MSNEDYAAHNAGQIVKYLELVWPLIEKGVTMPDEPPDRKARGSSRSVLSDWAEDLVWTNRFATQVLEPVIQDAKRSEARLKGIHFSSLLIEVVDDPMAVQNFRVQRGWRRADAFFRMCDLFALVIAEKNDGPGGPYRLDVELHPIKESAQALIEQRENPNRIGYGRARSFVAHDSYRRMVESMERMVLEGYTKEEAKKAKAEELMCSPGRVRDAITFVNAERKTIFSRGVAWAPAS